EDNGDVDGKRGTVIDEVFSDKFDDTLLGKFALVRLDCNARTEGARGEVVMVDGG
ncbi:unnamed protein product, partial [Didymodactylos carnosus]